MLSEFYKTVVIEKPLLSLCAVFLFVGFFSFYSTSLKLDASAESIVLENDEDLKYYRGMLEKYGSDDFLIITYTPREDIFSPTSLTTLQSLRDQLSKLTRVQSVLTILDVPLLNSPKITISELTDGAVANTLETIGIDKDLARQEFQESPIYQNNLVSLDGRTSVLQVLFKRDEEYQRLLKERNQLREKKATVGLTLVESEQLEAVSSLFNNYHARVTEIAREDIRKIRDIIDQHRDNAQLYLGGVRMITADMISFIEHDIVVFGLGVVGFLIVALGYFFKKLRWVALPMSCCLITVLAMVGLLGWFDWRITVISSNFISLLLIITMSLTIHLVVRYQIVLEEQPKLDQKTVVFQTMKTMVKPCFYTAITTIVAFCSLVVSGIRPVIDFGWMMTIGIFLAFVLNFIYFPAVLSLLRPEAEVTRPDATRSFTMAIAAFTQKYAKAIVSSCLVLAILGVIGIAQLDVENRFIDHFKSSTEIYQGMELIDSQLGGTIPLDVIIDADEDFFTALKEDKEMVDPFDDPFSEGGDTEELSYWFNGDRLQEIEQIHDDLERLPEVGKVLSIATGMKVFKQLNDQKLPQDYELALLKKWAPENVKSALINPYLSSDGNQIRITMRLIESAPNLKRKALINQIKSYLIEERNFAEENVHISGMAVLYNNLLQSLYQSQIVTLGVVFVSIFGMFVILFRSLALAIVAIIPNILAACAVLGMMGWMGVPLDIMTITIAAITVGIAVDHAIHYIHRFQMEFSGHSSYLETVTTCHGSIGRAIYYTALTIMVGFSILAFSSFLPTIHFGLLTGFAMLAALVSNLTLLPALLILFKPLGPAQQSVASTVTS